VQISEVVEKAKLMHMVVMNLFLAKRECLLIMAPQRIMLVD
jgi:hypothetical protein